ncbi:hypothetical protein N2W54_007744 [Lotmaria passim]
MSSSSTTAQSSSHGMVVEIAVQDPETTQERVFTCSLAPLRSHMRYFEPIIAKQMNEVKVAAVASPSGTTPPFTLRAKCDHHTFQWLLDWMNGNAPAMSLHNVVSITLSSSFLQMRALAEESLLYLRTHLPEIVSSGIDLRALPVELVLRLSRIVRDSDLAAVLQHLYDRKNTTHPNRIFVASLLQHYVCYRLGVEGEDEGSDDDSSPSAGKKNAAGRRSEVGVAHSSNNSGNDKRRSAVGSGSGVGSLTLKSSSGLRWCRLCACLFDQAEVQRLIRAFQLSSPECPAQAAMAGESSTAAAPDASPALSSSAGATAMANRSRSGSAPNTLSGPATVRYVGPRGEVFTTHAASRRALPVVLEAPPLLKYDSAATAASITASAMRLERWAWRIIGATRYVSCRRCFHLVPLVEVPSHHCSSLPPKFASPDNVAEDVNHLVRWFIYCTERRVYADEGGLTHVHFSGPRHVLAEEVVEVHVAPKSEPAMPTPQAAQGIASNDAAAEKDKKGASTPSLSLWAAKPFYVAEVMDKGIVDIDIQNYVERQHRFEVEAQQRRASVLFNPPHMRLASSPAVGQASFSSSPSPRFVSSVSGTSNAGSLNRGKPGVKPMRVRASTRSPYGF